MKGFFTHPFTIIIGSFLFLWALLEIGKKYWGWFPDPKTQRTDYGKGQASQGFPVIAFPGDTFVREGVKYTYTPITEDKSRQHMIQYAWLTDAQDKKGCSIFNN